MESEIYLECPNCSLISSVEKDIFKSDERLCCPSCMSSFTRRIDGSCVDVETTKVNLDNVEHGGNNILHWAAASGSKKLLKYGLNQDIYVDSKNEKYSITPLHLSACQNRREISELLIDHGANLHERSKNGDTVLHFSVKWDSSPELIEFFIDMGIDPNVTNNDNQTPLHAAAMRPESTEAVEALLENGADPNLRNDVGASPLHVACFYDTSGAIVYTLIKEGAEINSRTNDGYTPLDIVDMKDRHRIMDVIIKEGGHMGAAIGDNKTDKVSKSRHANKVVTIVYTEDMPGKGTDVFENVESTIDGGNSVTINFGDGTQKNIDKAYIEDIMVRRS